MGKKFKKNDNLEKSNFVLKLSENLESINLEIKIMNKINRNCLKLDKILGHDHLGVPMIAGSGSIGFRNLQNDEFS